MQRLRAEIRPSLRLAEQLRRPVHLQVLPLVPFPPHLHLYLWPGGWGAVRTAFDRRERPVEQSLHQFFRPEVPGGHIDDRKVVAEAVRDVCLNSVSLRHCDNHAHLLPSLPHVPDLERLHYK